MTREDRQIGSIAAVFDDLKDYLSDSDLSLDYKIALRRRKIRSNSSKWPKKEFESSNKENQHYPEPINRKQAIEYSGSYLKHF
jgi:hypothetical protein